jgi:hypothetical protein
LCERLAGLRDVEADVDPGDVAQPVLRVDGDVGLAPGLERDDRLRAAGREVEAQ